MKLNTKDVLKAFEIEEMIDARGPMTTGRALVEALMSPASKTSQTTGEEIMDRYDLALKLRNEEEVEVDDGKLKEILGFAYRALAPIVFAALKIYIEKKMGDD
jgi:hypothetical protein